MPISVSSSDICMEKIQNSYRGGEREEGSRRGDGGGGGKWKLTFRSQYSDEYYT